MLEEKITKIETSESGNVVRSADDGVQEMKNGEY